MARIVINRQILNGMYVATPAQDVVFTTLSNADGNYLRMAGGEILLFQGAGTATIVGVTDPYGRAANITVTPGADIAVVGPLMPVGFLQSDDSVYIDSTGSIDVAFLAPAR